MQKGQIFFVVLIGIFLGGGLFAKDFEWAAISEADWEVTADSANNIRNAVMLFEKLEVDDQKMVDGKTYYTLYRRVRILSPEGREWGDVEIPYVNKKQKIEKIEARTVLRDGQIFLLNKDDIYEKEIIKTKDVKIKQKSFSLPGMTDDCIVEYYLKLRLPDSENQWVTEKEIYLKEGELTWLFYRGRGMSNYFYGVLSDYFSPNYLWENMAIPPEMESLPNEKKAEKIIFRVKDVPPFTAESHTQPDEAIKGNIRFYYSTSSSATDYWGDLGNNINKMVKKFTEYNKKAKKVVEQFDTLATRDEKIYAAYNWLQKNIDNTSYKDDEDEEKKYKPIEAVDDVIKYGYGSSTNINMTFLDMLQLMGIDAKFVYAVDRDDNSFNRQAKYWQFDRSMVGIQNSSNKFTFYNPAAKYLPPESVAWYNEGSIGLVVSDLTATFATIHSSFSRDNIMRRTLDLRMTDDAEITGRIVEEYKGHFGREIRFKLDDLTEDEQIEFYKERAKENYVQIEIDSIMTQNISADDWRTSVRMKCQVAMESAGQLMGNRILIKPSHFFSRQENPFQTETRKYPIVFDFAHEIFETISIVMPEGWIVEAVPEDQRFANRVGECHIQFRNFNNGKLLSLQRVFKLKYPMIKPEFYSDVRELFNVQQLLEEKTIILSGVSE